MPKAQKDLSEDTHCSTRARFLRANHPFLRETEDLELWEHFPNRPLPRHLRGSPPPVLPPVPPSVRVRTPDVRPTVRATPRVDYRMLAANDHSRDDD